MFEKKDEIINISILFLITIFIIIVFIVSIFKGEYNDFYYENIKNNWSKTPIIEIITTDSKTKTNELTAFLGYYGKNMKKIQKTYIWKDRKIELKRMNSQYNYPSLYNFKQNENKKKCGKDSLGNYLYFRINETCPINLITNKNDTKYNYKEIKFKNKSLYYTNECIECSIIVDFRVSIKIGPSFDELNGGDICSIYNCKFSKPNDYDDLSYTKIDSYEGSYFLYENNIISSLMNNRGILYLHTRSYVGVYDSDFFFYRENPILNKMLNIKSKSLRKNIFCPIILIVIIILKFQELNYEDNIGDDIGTPKKFLILNFFLFILILFVLIYVGYFIVFYYNMKNNVILKMNSPIVYYYHSYTNIMILNIIVEFLLFFILFYLFISFIHILSINWKFFKYNFWIFGIFSSAKYEKEKEVLDIKKNKLDKLYNELNKEVKSYEKKLDNINEQYNNLNKEDKILNKKMSLIDEIQKPMEKNKELKLDKSKKEKIKIEYEKYKDILLQQNIDSLEDYENEIIKKENIENDLKNLTEKIKKAKQSGNKEINELMKMKNLIEQKLIEVENRLKYQK